MPDPRDPTPVRAVQRNGRWVVVDADGRRLPDQEPLDTGPAARAVVRRVNSTWKSAKSERTSKGGPAITEGLIRKAFNPLEHPRAPRRRRGGGQFMDRPEVAAQQRELDRDVARSISDKGRRADRVRLEPRNLDDKPLHEMHDAELAAHHQDLLMRNAMASSSDTMEKTAKRLGPATAELRKRGYTRTQKGEWKKLKESYDVVLAEIDEAAWSDVVELEELKLPFAGKRLHFKFNPALHERDRVGKFSEMVGKIENKPHGSRVSLPHGVFVRQGTRGLEVWSEGEKHHRFKSAAAAAAEALYRHDHAEVAHGKTPWIHHARLAGELESTAADVKHGPDVEKLKARREELKKTGRANAFIETEKKRIADELRGIKLKNEGWKGRIKTFTTFAHHLAEDEQLPGWARFGAQLGVMLAIVPVIPGDEIILPAIVGALMLRPTTRKRVKELWGQSHYADPPELDMPAAEKIERKLKASYQKAKSQALSPGEPIPQLARLVGLEPAVLAAADIEEAIDFKALLHPRVPKGRKGGGRFMDVLGKLEADAQPKSRVVVQGRSGKWEPYRPKPVARVPVDFFGPAGGPPARRVGGRMSTAVDDWTRRNPLYQGFSDANLEVRAKGTGKQAAWARAELEHRKSRQARAVTGRAKPPAPGGMLEKADALDRIRAGQHSKRDLALWGKHAPGKSGRRTEPILDQMGAYAEAERSVPEVDYWKLEDTSYGEKRELPLPDKLSAMGVKKIVMERGDPQTEAETGYPWNFVTTHFADGSTDEQQYEQWHDLQHVYRDAYVEALSKRGRANYQVPMHLAARRADDRSRKRAWSLEGADKIATYSDGGWSPNLEVALDKAGKPIAWNIDDPEYLTPFEKDGAEDAFKRGEAAVRAGDALRVDMGIHKPKAGRASPAVAEKAGMSLEQIQSKLKPGEKKVMGDLPDGTVIETPQGIVAILKPSEGKLTYGDKTYVAAYNIKTGERFEPPAVFPPAKSSSAPAVKKAAQAMLDQAGPQPAQGGGPGPNLDELLGQLTGLAGGAAPAPSPVAEPQFTPQTTKLTKLDPVPAPKVAPELTAAAEAAASAGVDLTDAFAQGQDASPKNPDLAERRMRAAAAVLEADAGVKDAVLGLIGPNELRQKKIDELATGVVERAEKEYAFTPLVDLEVLGGVHIKDVPIQGQAVCQMNTRQLSMGSTSNIGDFRHELGHAVRSAWSGGGGFTAHTPLTAEVSQRFDEAKAKAAGATGGPTGTGTGDWKANALKQAWWEQHGVIDPRCLDNWEENAAEQYRAYHKAIYQMTQTDAPDHNPGALEHYRETFPEWARMWDAWYTSALAGAK